MGDSLEDLIAYEVNIIIAVQLFEFSLVAFVIAYPALVGEAICQTLYDCFILKAHNNYLFFFTISLAVLTTEPTVKPNSSRRELIFPDAPNVLIPSTSPSP